MNERIEELKERAYDNQTNVFDVDKFAELIINNCIDICKNYSDSVFKYSQFGSQGANDCIQLIKEHFKIERY